MHDPLSQFLEGYFQQWSAAIGFPADKLKLVLMLVSGYAFAFIHSYLPRGKNYTTLHHLYSLVLGAYSGWLMFGYDLAHTLLCIVVVFAMVKAMNPESVGKYVFVFTMAYLLGCHAYRLYTDPGGWTMDFTGSQMLLTLKLSSFAFSWGDGHRKNKLMLDHHQKRFQVTEMPSFLEFVAFCYFYLGFLAGPVFELVEYREYISGKLFERKGKNGETVRSMPSGRFGASLLSFLSSLVCLVIFQLMGNVVKAEYLTSDWFHASSTPMLARAIFVYLAGVRTRFQYYFAWTLSAGSTQMAGIGFSGVDTQGNMTWTRGNNVNILACEGAQNVKALTDNWNLRVDAWLKHHIYARVNESKYKALSVYATLLTSAVWHGIYAGYYLSFLTAALIVEVMRMGRRVVRPFFMQADGRHGNALKPCYDLFTWVGSCFILNYTLCPFVLLWARDGIRLWSSFHYGGHVILVVLFILFKALGGGKKKKTVKTQ